MEKNKGVGPHKYNQLIFEEDAKAIWWRKDCLFNKWCHKQKNKPNHTNKPKMELDTDTVPYPEIN